MQRITVQYAVPSDPAAFDEAYVSRHIPIALKLPGLQSFTYSKVRPLGGEPTVYMIAELNFPDADTLKAALKSPEMAAAGQDAAALGVPSTMFTGEVTEA